MPAEYSRTINFCQAGLAKLHCIVSYCTFIYRVLNFIGPSVLKNMFKKVCTSCDSSDPGSMFRVMQVIIVVPVRYSLDYRSLVWHRRRASLSKLILSARREVELGLMICCMMNLTLLSMISHDTVSRSQ